MRDFLISAYNIHAKIAYYVGEAAHMRGGLAKEEACEKRHW
jgi:hypothetical protein